MDKYKRQLYPKRNDSVVWKMNNELSEDVLLPDEKDVEGIYNLIFDLISRKEEKIIKDKKDDIYNIKKYLWSIFSKNEVNFDFKDLKIDIVKGSIYKIKKYFMEVNNIQDIRGGSMMVDYLNIDYVEKSIINLGLNYYNIIYCGGGNILLVVPQGMGKKICAFFESELKKRALTLKCAFDFIEKTLDEFLFEFKLVKDELDEKVNERSKVKLYYVGYDNELDNIQFKFKENSDKEDYTLNLKKYFVKENLQVICSSCDINNAKYCIKSGDEEKYYCSSCARKHLLGKREDNLINKYEKYIKNKYNMELKNKKDLFKGSLDDIFKKQDIAVIYGDGNNMGNVVEQIDNVFSMMYFSRRTDKITKESVYEAIYNNMNCNAVFQIIALGGDDIFIVVPANHALKIASDIICNFDDKFNHDITMSVGVVISKVDTPIASTFDLAQQRLKIAKELVKQKGLKEGSIDVLELTGEFHDTSESKNREFPMSNSSFIAFKDEVINARENVKLNSQLNKLSYAKSTMEEEEFNLFYYYQKSKSSTIDDFIHKVYRNINSKKYLSPYNVNWDDILLMWKRI